jgi:mRNA interferase HigB
MKVHLIKRQTIEEFAKMYPGSRTSFDKFLNEIKAADWNQPADMKNTFGATDFLGRGSDRVVFDIGGNSYRMICKYFFGQHQVHLFICWIGSHKDYDRLCAKNAQYTINAY